MNIIKYFVYISLIMSYGLFISNLIKGNYRNNLKSLCLDAFAAYALSPLISIALIWDFIEGIRER